MIGIDHSSLAVASRSRPRQAIHAVSTTSDPHPFYKTTQHAWRFAPSTDSETWDGFPKEYKTVHTVSTQLFFLALAAVSPSRAFFLAAAASSLCLCAISARLRRISCWRASIAACFALAVFFICQQVFFCQESIHKTVMYDVSHHLDKERVRSILTPIQVFPEEKQKRHRSIRNNTHPNLEKKGMVEKRRFDVCFRQVNRIFQFVPKMPLVY